MAARVLRRLTGIRELPIMQQVKDFSLEIVLAIIIHDIIELICRAEVVQRVGSIYVFRDVCLPSDVASCLALSLGQSGGQQEIIGQYCICMCKALG